MRTAVLLIVFAGAWALTCAVANPLYTRPVVDILGAKLATFEQQKDEFTSLFIGSSRVYREVVPEVFEAEMARRGHDERVFNFGVMGMDVPESTWALREVLEMQPAKLRWVFFELQTFRTDLDDDNFLSDRQVGWHAYGETRLMSDSIMRDANRDFTTRVSDAWQHWRHFFAYASGLSLGKVALPFEVPLPANVAGSQEVIQGDQLTNFMRRQQGWVPLEFESGSQYERRSKKFQREQDLFHADIEDLKVKPSYIPELVPHHRAVIERVIELVEPTGARLVFVIMPGLSHEMQFTTAFADGLIPTLVAMNNPRRFPFLYRADARFDAAHLKQPASRAFTRMFIETLVEQGLLTDLVAGEDP